MDPTTELSPFEKMQQEFNNMSPDEQAEMRRDNPLKAPDSDAQRAAVKAGETGDYTKVREEQQKIAASRGTDLSKGEVR